MSGIFTMVITDAGLAAIDAADGPDLALTFTEIAFGTGLYEVRDGSGDALPAAQALTALSSEVERIDLTAAAPMAERQVMVIATLPGGAEFDVGEFGIFLDDGTLFCVASRASAAYFTRGASETALQFILSWDAADAAAVNVTTNGDAALALLAINVANLEAALETKLDKAGGTVAGDLVVNGNLTVNGDTTTVNSDELHVGDSIIRLNADLDDAVAPSLDSGIEVNRGSEGLVSFLWMEEDNLWEIDGSLRLGKAAGTTPVLSRNNGGGLLINSAGAVSSVGYLLEIAEGGAVRFSIDGNGNGHIAKSLGIGTTATPASTLEIANNDRMTGGVLSITNSFVGSGWTAGDVLGQVDFRIDDSSATERVRGRISVVEEQAAAATFPSQNAMVFHTGSVNDLIERFRLNSYGHGIFSGRVGIGTSAEPSSCLEVYTTGNANLVRLGRNSGAGWLELFEGAIRKAYIGYEAAAGGGMASDTHPNSLVVKSTVGPLHLLGGNGNVSTGITVHNDRADFGRAVNVEGKLAATGGAKISIQNKTDGGSNHGLFLYDTDDTAFGIYMSQSGSGRSLNDLSACVSLDGRGGYHTRFRHNSSSNQGWIWENNSEQCLMSLTSDTGVLYTLGGFYTSGKLTVNGGAKISVQDQIDGGSEYGIFLWDTNGTSYGIYTATAGPGKSLSDGVACGSLSGQSLHHIRMRINNNPGRGFIWENDAEQCLMSLTADTGDLHLKRQTFAKAHRATANRTITGDDAITADDYRLFVKRVVGAPTALTLPVGFSGAEFVIKDALFDARTNNITITGSGGELIDGEANFVINRDGQSITIVFHDGAWYVI